MKIVCAWMYAIGRFGFPPKMGAIFKALAEMKEMGFDYIEMEGIGYENLDQVINHRSEIKKILNESDLKISNFAVLLPDTISMDKKIKAKALTYFERGIETARYLDSEYAWIDSYFPPLKLEKGILPTESLVFGQDLKVTIPDDFIWEKFWENFVQSIIACNEIAKKNQIKLLIEPRVGEVISNTDGLLRLTYEVNDDNFGVILDIAHQHAQKEIIPLSIDKLGQRIKYVHVADNDGSENRHFEPGKGTVDWDEVFRMLKRSNFTGFFAIDLEKLPSLKQKFLYSQKFLEEYAEKFSL